MKSFFGKSFLGIVRMTFWIGPDGNIRKIWPKVTPRGHAAEVLAAHSAGLSASQSNAERIALPALDQHVINQSRAHLSRTTDDGAIST